MRKQLSKGLNTAIGLCLLVSMAGCQFTGLNTVPKLRDDEKAVVVKSIETNKSYILHTLDEMQLDTSRNMESANIPTEEVKKYLNNPDLLIQDLLQEENGEEYLDFLYTVSTTGDVNEILDKASLLLSEEEYNTLQDSIATIESRSMIFAQSRATGIQIDKIAHAFAGAAVAMVTAAVVYAVTPTLSVPAKLAAAAALGVSAGIVAGGLKELYDYYSYGGSPDWIADWAATVAGAAAGAAVATGIAAVCSAIALGPAGSAIICGVLGAACGYTALKIVRIL